MRKITKIIIHCSATKEGNHYTERDIKKWHTSPKPGGNGWQETGYHFVILLDGSIEVGRSLEIIGAHCAGNNANSIGICYVGGLDNQGRAKDTRTEAQKQALKKIIKMMLEVFPLIKEIKGHRDYSPDKNNNGIIEVWEWLKECPSFDAEKEYKYLLK